MTDEPKHKDLISEIYSIVATATFHEWNEDKDEPYIPVKKWRMMCGRIADRLKELGYGRSDGSIPNEEPVDMPICKMPEFRGGKK